MKNNTTILLQIASHPFIVSREGTETYRGYYDFRNPFELIVYDKDSISIFEYFSSRKIVVEDLYALTNTGKFITYFSCYKKKTCSGIHLTEHIYESSAYICGDANLCERHFTRDTKIKKLRLGHKFLARIFGNSVVNGEDISKDGMLDSVKVTAKGTNKKKLDTLKFEDTQAAIEIFQGFSYAWSLDNGYVLKPQTYIEIEFEKTINIMSINEVVKEVETAIYLSTTTRLRFEEIIVISNEHNQYYYSYSSKCNEKLSNRIGAISEVEKNETNFIFAMRKLFNMDEDMGNAYFPFREFDNLSSSPEIQYLDYYKVLEFVVGKAKNNLGSIEILRKEFPSILEKHYPNTDGRTVERRLRSLRNHYSHTGYFLATLRVPTDKKSKCIEMVQIDRDFKITALNYVRDLSFAIILREISLKSENHNYSAYF